MRFPGLPEDHSKLILDTFTPSYRYIQLEDEDFIRIYGLTVFVDELIMRKSLDTYFKICGGVKQKILVDPTLEIGMSSGARNMLRKEVPLMTTSMALMTTNPFTQLTANLFLKIRNDNFKVRLFRDHEKAVSWLKEQ
ncbi:MAG: hypothetical protein R2780_05915 [Crocinitomicaceae bacterium]|nr:hypothetical protein [Crocinitomicaceae bacterium]